MGIGIKDKFRKLATRTGELVEKAKPSQEQTAVFTSAIEQAGNAVLTGAKVMVDRAKQQLETTAGKKVAAASAAGAAIVVPLPIIGPISGAVIGGLVGLWLTHGERAANTELENRCRKMTPSERQEELAKLEQLRQSGDVSEVQYMQLRKMLGGL
jgi:hypothetical protein